MELVSIKINPRGNSGWGSQELTFGKYITQLYGPNGSGKTPLVKSIAFALGYDAKFRDDIFTHCHSVNLKIKINGNTYSIKRVYSKELDITVKEPNDNIQTFYQEGHFSSYIMELIGYEYPYLVTTNNKATTPYLSTLLPLFYLDQDNGYSEYYKPPKNAFIKDQHQEMIKIGASLPPKNSFDKAKSKLMAKKDLERADSKVSTLKSLYEDALEKKEGYSSNAANLDERITKLENDLSSLQSGNTDTSKITRNIDENITLNLSKLRKLIEKRNSLYKRIKSVDSISSDIETEINTLSLNEEARRKFMSFSEICSVEGCGMFLKSTEAYGKNLLYLKDQIKDLNINARKSEDEIIKLTEYITIIEKKIDELNLERSQLIEKSEIDKIVEGTTSITTELVQLKLAKRQQIVIEELEVSLVQAQNQRNSALDKIESLGSVRSLPSIKHTKFKSNLKRSLLRWLDALQTKNVPRNIEIFNDYKPKFDGESLNQFAGSTRLRIVLSYHAALFEELIKATSTGIRFLILDTPRQQDISTEDFELLIISLKDLARQLNIQVIFSTTAYRFKTERDDNEWTPSFNGFEQPMFLGNVNTND